MQKTLEIETELERKTEITLFEYLWRFLTQSKPTLIGKRIWFTQLKTRNPLLPKLKLK